MVLSVEAYLSYVTPVNQSFVVDVVQHTGSEGEGVIPSSWNRGYESSLQVSGSEAALSGTEPSEVGSILPKACDGVIVLGGNMVQVGELCWR